MSGRARIGTEEADGGERGGGGTVRSSVVSVGEELLLGETVNTNAAWLGRELGTVGAPVAARFTVGDEDGAIALAVSRALEAAELVLVTGGLGPTDDDRTKEAVAELLERPLESDPELLEALARRFRSFGYDRLPPSNRSQAEVPRGGDALSNPRGTAPGLWIDVGDGVVVLLPGVPREMRGIFRESVAARIRARFGDRLRPLRHRTIHTTGIPESVLADRVEERLEGYRGPVTVAFLPDVTGVDLRLTVRDVADDAEAGARLDEMEELLGPTIEGRRYDAESGDLVEAVTAALRARGWTVATAESCTGGLVAKRLTDLAGSSDVFVGGVVSYANASKIRDLDVPPRLIDEHGAVSGEVAASMVEGVVRRFGSDCGISITGIAGPEGGTEEKPVGTVWYAASVRGEIGSRRSRFPGSRADVRERSAQAALHLLLRSIERGGT
ncbi:MAG: competence/damage-inducible protein A [Gemmatimonadetes bacterium]|nr:competence/damage-inducible protein A [Gemmatimonadota bacterium]NIR80488.1 competence/damage-inducible protein A [Gemmatimonadota bacterium]NIT89249.1 competence/damage-inducible protein A [Gemmatimonadota bacterium]NIU33048.1 competence/damage-inducible protein A [Gemmatimonadota bacterium]NIU37429.1 competence/damage-inducible protein A [Gemmatimonadota bacterium]